MGLDCSKYRILVVDDIPSNVLLLRVILEQEKFQIVTARDGMEALELISKEKIDLILLDIMMPEMSGFEVAEKIKSDKIYASIPILFITALNSSEEIVKGFKSGGSDYITKPFNKDELIMRVRHQISLVDARETILEQTEKLKSAIKARDKLYSVIAHDLRSPISSLKMVLSVLSSKAREENINVEFTKMLDTGSEISEQVFCLLDNLLKWAKGQSGLLEPIFQSFYLDEIIQSVAEVAFSSAKIKQIKLDLVLEPSIEVSIDTDMIKSVIRNLIFNAIKFSYPNSTITICLEKTRKEAIVKVQDTGCGINEENQKLLRSRISRFSTYGTNKEEGTGLGLLLSYHFIKLHQGKLLFNSEEGKGSCFQFSIPLIKKESILTEAL